MHSPFLNDLEKYDRLMLMGAGGGFDIFSGIPLYEYLVSRGKRVFLGNLSFADLIDHNGDRIRSNYYLEVNSDTPGNNGYFPERGLSRWYREKGREVTIFAFHGSGARTVLNIYLALKKKLDFQALVLVDGGTDSLMRGDEPGLGTPAEDIASIAAASMLDGVETYLVNLGFGVDYHHKVCHVYVLEAIADMTKTGDYLGAFSLIKGMPEFDAFCEAVEYVNALFPERASIVASSILAAGEGHFGDYHHTDRVRGQELFINPLMSIYWCFRLRGVINRCLYLDYIKDTHSRMDVHRALSNYLYVTKTRPWRTFPH